MTMDDCLKNRMDYSCGVMAYYFCLNKEVPGLFQHNVFLGSDYKASWDRPWTPSDLDAPKQPNFYVHKPSYTDTTTGTSCFFCFI